MGGHGLDLGLFSSLIFSSKIKTNVAAVKTANKVLSLLLVL